MDRKKDKPQTKGKKKTAIEEYLSSEDKSLWRHVSSKVKPIESNRYTIHKDVLASSQKSSESPAQPAGKAKKYKRLSAEPTQGNAAKNSFAALKEIKESHTTRVNVAGIDRNTSEKLRRGKMEIEGRVDLHGHTRREAHARLRSFIHSAHRHGKRCVIVITGKGSTQPKTDDAPYMIGNRKGVLREEVPRWLNEPDLRPLVLDFKTAQPRHGGSGALYVLLKRSRTDRGKA